MSLNDPISNLLTIIRNGSQIRKETVDIPGSKMAGNILQIFKDNGYIEDFRFMKNNVQGTFKVYLKYDGKKSTITGLKKISKSGLRVYVEASSIPKVLNGLGTAVMSTSKGVISGREARKLNIGGEVLCHIW